MQAMHGLIASAQRARKCPESPPNSAYVELYIQLLSPESWTYESEPGKLGLSKSSTQGLVGRYDP